MPKWLKVNGDLYLPLYDDEEESVFPVTKDPTLDVGAWLEHLDTLDEEYLILVQEGCFDPDEDTQPWFRPGEEVEPWMWAPGEEMGGI